MQYQTLRDHRNPVRKAALTMIMKDL